MKAKRFRAVEVAMTSLALWWSFVLVLPFDTFSTSIAYQAMSQIASELAWGLFMGAIGIAQLIGMISNNYKIKKVSLIAATFVWFFMAAAFGYVLLYSTATGTYFIIACLSSWLYRKVGGQYEHGC